MELRSSEISSLIYHDIFDYPLTFFELKKWKLNPKIKIESKKKVNKDDNYYFLKGREGLVNKRIKRERFSKEKLIIAQKASKVLSTIPTIKLVGLTGALAMNNVNCNSDIDLLIITKKGTLWTTRLISYLLLVTFSFKIRKPNDNNQKNKLCLNMWLDEENLKWPENERNIYTAHELAQIYPMFNKNKTYQKLINQNSWILDYWPNSVKIQNSIKIKSKKYLGKTSIVESLAFKLQYLYMKNKITREVITPTRAIFHPIDWGKTIINKLTP